MERKKYNDIVKKYTIPEARIKNGLISFLVGGFMGILGNF